MTQPAATGAQSMRFAPHEVLAGMLATIEADDFSDDPQKLAAMFEGLGSRFALFAPLSSGVDVDAVGTALNALEAKQMVAHGAGRWAITVEGRKLCAGSKRTLFNQGDREQLEEAARSFNEL